MVEEEIKFRGHPNVLSLHKMTIEITKETHLTPRGDCIIGVGANKACSDLSESLKKGLRNTQALVRFEVVVGNESFVIEGRGDDRLSLLDRNDIVIRKSQFVCPRTVSVRSNKASSDLPRSMIMALRDPDTTGFLRVSTE